MNKTTTETSTENGFRETEIGLIPSDWDVESIINIVEKAKMADPTKNPNVSFKYIDVSGISNESFRIVSYKTCRGSDAPSRARKLINKDDVIFATVRPTLKRIAYVNEVFNGEICSTAFCILRSKKDVLSSRYLYYCVQRDEFVEELTKLERGASYPAVTDSNIRDQKIPLPKIEEQQKIAFVLSKIQQAIEQQDKIIQITKELKKSLMNKLFTEGLHGEEQKETEIGLIPKSWSITPAEKFCERVTDGTHESPKPAESGYYLVTSKNLKEGKIIFDGCYLISAENYKSVNERSKVDLYDVVFGMIGTLGSPVIIRKEPDFAIKNVGLFKTGKNKDLGLWLYYYLSSDSVGRLVDKQKAGATQKYIPLWFLRQLPIPVPSEKERNDITRILEDISLKLDAEENRLITLKNLFKTMLNQLMTGRVRVKNLDIEVN